MAFMKRTTTASCQLGLQERLVAVGDRGERE
jgi:hypothetical protein